MVLIEVSVDVACIPVTLLIISDKCVIILCCTMYICIVTLCVQKWKQQFHVLQVQSAASDSNGACWTLNGAIVQSLST